MTIFSKTYRLLFFCLLLVASAASAQTRTVSDDKQWDQQLVELKNAGEAELIIRIGDVDNLGFGWPEGFDPFCGRMTQPHAYPWEANPADKDGFDRILLSGIFKPEAEHLCGGDGYSGYYNAELSRPVTYQIPTTTAKGMDIKNAYLQIFIDDFQANTFCSRFQVTINNNRFAEGERILNAIDQTGPVGKLVTIPVPEEFFAAINSGDPIKFKIDEIKGAADGFAIDFIRLLINRKRESSCKGNVRGRVLEKGTDISIENAIVSTQEKISAKTDDNGAFKLTGVPTGFEVLSATASGYSDGTGMADIGPGDDNSEVVIYLEKGTRKVDFNDHQIAVGESVSLNNILFDAAKSDLRPASQTELNKIVDFMQKNPKAEIELSGHTSSEGDAAYNRSLSYRRVKACKDYIVSKGIDAGRIIAIGFGPAKPVAPNDTEANRAKNRRVEMRVMKL